MFKNIKIDGVSYPDETFNIDLTPPARHQGCLFTGNAVYEYVKSQLEEST